MSKRFPVRVDEEGRLVPLHPERTRRLRGREVWIELHLKPAMVQRSLPANNYLWGVVYARIAEETGNDVDDIHYGLKREAVRRGILDLSFISLGDLTVEAEPTTVTDSEVFWNYVSWIRSEAMSGRLTGTAFHIPEPNEEVA